MALILGHSQVKYMHEYILSDNIVTLCYPGFRVREFMDLNIVSEMVPSFPVVVVVAGANDIPYSDAATVLGDLQTLCEKIRSYNPGVTVMVCGVLPRGEDLHRDGHRLSTDFLLKFNEVAAEVNSCLRMVEQHVPWMKYIDIPGFMSCADFHTPEMKIQLPELQRT